MLRWRPDGDLVRNVPDVRRIMPFLMRTRNESIVFFEQKVHTEQAKRFLQDFREATGLRATLLHLLIWASARTLDARPRLNRFTAGGRIWQRRGIWISFSAKKAKHDDAPIVVVKRRVDPAWSFEELVRHIEAGITDGRSDAPSSTDKELKLLFLLPTFLLSWFVHLARWLDHHGLLPRAFLDGDPMFASMFIANLGSIDMQAGFHHLYEYGNIPIFMTVGRSELDPVIDEDGRVSARERMTLRYSFDERVEDGLYCARALELLKAMLEDPRGAGARFDGSTSDEAAAEPMDALA